MTMGNDVHYGFLILEIDVKSIWEYLDLLWILISFLLGIFGATVNEKRKEKREIKRKLKYCLCTIDEIRTDVLEIVAELKKQKAHYEKINKGEILMGEPIAKRRVQNTPYVLYDALPPESWFTCLNSEKREDRYVPSMVARSIHTGRYCEEDVERNFKLILEKIPSLHKRFNELRTEFDFEVNEIRKKSMEWQPVDGRKELFEYLKRNIFYKLLEADNRDLLLLNNIFLEIENKLVELYIQFHNPIEFARMYELVKKITSVLHEVIYYHERVVDGFFGVHIKNFEVEVLPGLQRIVE